MATHRDVIRMNKPETGFACKKTPSGNMVCVFAPYETPNGEQSPLRTLINNGGFNDLTSVRPEKSGLLYKDKKDDVIVVG